MIKNLLSKCLFVFLSLILFNCISFSQTKPDKIDELLKTYNNYGQFNGAALVAEKGQVILKKGYGFANMEWGIKNESDTKFRLGSITKQFTSMLIMQIVEAGKLKTEDKISTYLPYYRKDNAEKITVHHLLTHTSGIPNYTAMPDFREKVSRNPYSVEEFTKQYCSNNLEFEPGTKFQYSNSGYFILGAIIEKITGKKYEEVLKEKILIPLMMKNTGYDNYGTILSKRASGYEKSLSGYNNAAYLDMSIPFSAGSLYSTVEDLYLWDQALYTEKVLSEKYKNLLFKPGIPALGGSYAYGWVINQIKVGDVNKTVIAHGGGINGFNTVIVRIIDDKHLIILLNNTGSANLNAISTSIQNILYDQPYNKPKKSIADALLNLAIEKGIDAAIAKYNEIKTNEKDSYDLRESELNTLGYQLINANKLKEAIEILKLNVSLYPNSSNVYDSLGEAYMMNGDKDLAIKNYEKSVELDPKNTSGIEALKKLKGK